MNFRNNFPPQSGRFNGPVNNCAFNSDRQQYKGKFAAYNPHASFERPSPYVQSSKGTSSSNMSSFSNNRLSEQNRRNIYDNYSQRGDRNYPQMAFAGGNLSGGSGGYGQQSKDCSRADKQQSRIYNNHYVIPDRATRRSFYNEPCLDNGTEIDYYNYEGKYLPSEYRAKKRGDCQVRSNRTRFFSNIATRNRGSYEEDYDNEGYSAIEGRSKRRVDEEYDDRRSAAPGSRSRKRLEEERRKPRGYSRDLEEECYEEDDYEEDGYEERMPRNKRAVATKRSESREQEYDDYEDEEYEEASSENVNKRKKPFKRMICREEDEEYEEAPVKKSSGINFFKKKKRQ